MVVKIQPEKIEPNYIELPILESPIQGMAIDAAPQPNNPATPISGSNIVPGPGGSVLAGGFFQSPNFVAGSSGWKIDAAGDVEFGSGKFRGNITGASGTFSGTLSATTGSIGGWSISANAIYKDGATDNVSAGMAPADYPFYAGKKYADRATAPFKVEPSGKLTVTDIVATGVINAQSGYLSAGVYVDTVNGLLCESGGLNVGTSGHIRGGATDYATGVGFFLGYSGGAYKFSVGDPAGKYINWTGTDFIVNGFVVSSKGTFRGDGSDGALAITLGTTTIDVGAVSVYIKNYSSISITGTGKLAFSNPISTGTKILLKSIENIDITATAPCINASGMGGARGTGGAEGIGAQPYRRAGTTGSNGIGILDDLTHLGGTSAAADVNLDDTGGSAGVALTVNNSVYYTNTALKLFEQGIKFFSGSGGGGGASGMSTSDSGYWGAAGGNGGAGGGALMIHCGGAWNFTTPNGISVAGQNGQNGFPGNNSIYNGYPHRGGGGGGGGGSSGMFICLYNSLTANTGSVVATGGNGGAGGATYGDAASAGCGGAGGGGAGARNAGGVGGTGKGTEANAVGGNGSNVGSGAGGGGGGGAGEKDGTGGDGTGRAGGIGGTTGTTDSSNVYFDLNTIYS